MRLNTLLRKTLLISAILPMAIAAYPVDRRTVLPLTQEDVETYVRQAEESIAKTVEMVATLPGDQKTPQILMRSWNRFGNELLAKLSPLAFLSKNEWPSKDAAAQSIPELIGFLFKSLVLDPRPYQSLIEYAEEALKEGKSLTPYEYYEIQSLLASCEAIQYSLSKPQQAQLSRLKGLCDKYEKKPFIEWQGEADDKISSQKAFTVFCLNTCFLPGDMAYFCGGVVPWERRVDPLAEQILASDPDVICLQEVHGQDASYALYERLKKNYAYFYGSIAPRVLGFSIETLGLPSGLFVASKFPIEKPTFTLFPVSGFQMNYGVFDFTIKNGDVPLAHIYTTHMQSLNFEGFPEIRHKQLTHILEKMEADYNSSSELEQGIPYFLCGDLNVPRDSGEPSEELIKTYFYDFYNHNRGEINQHNRTCTEHFNQHFLAPIQGDKIAAPVHEILDYALLLDTLPSCLCRTFSKNFHMETVQVPMNDLEAPESALSDHHALLTTISSF